MKKHYIYTLLYMIYLLTGCSSDMSSADQEAFDSSPQSASDFNTQLQNQIFYNTTSLEIEIKPVNSNSPSFAWTATGSRYMVIAIFKDKIDLKENRIANTQDAIWSWHSGIGRGREGNVSYSDGVDMINGQLQSASTLLNPGVYYILAWGYDGYYNLAYSSEEYLYEYNGE